jgi:hypothetical protein
VLRTVSECDFWRREIPAWHGWWGKGEFEYCFLINSQDRDPATFTEEDYKQLEDRQNTSPVEITTKVSARGGGFLALSTPRLSIGMTLTS